LQCVQVLQKGLVGVEASTGKLLWRFGKAVSRFNANIPTPVAGGEYIYVASAGTGGGLVRVRVQQGQFEPEQVYFEARMPTAIGGVVKVGESFYGTTAQSLLCFDFLTGNVRWQERALGAASLLYADDRLYLHGENGEVALVEPSADSYRERGRFAPQGQPERASSMEKAWAYPVVSNGRLYIRQHNSIWCYDVREER
jgi:outer membrane protein assembly factor BamB